MSSEQYADTPGRDPTTTGAASIEPSSRTTAFDRELIELLPHMRAFSQFLTRDHDKARDLVQDAVVRILRAQHQYQPGTNFKAWVFVILRNIHINGFRAKIPETLDLDDPSVVVCSVRPQQQFMLEFQELRRAMLKLSPEHREVLILVGANGFSYEEAAVICGCALGTIKSRLSRGRDEIFRLLGGLPGDWDDELSTNGAYKRPCLVNASTRAGAASKAASGHQLQ